MINIDKAIAAVKTTKTEIQNAILEEIKANRFDGVKQLAGAQQKLDGIETRLNEVVTAAKEREAERQAKAKAKK